MNDFKFWKDINFNVIKVLFLRDLRLYFASPSGYVFITLFIFLSAFAAFWQERFFMNNLANLNLLNVVFPYLLLFFIPALTMGVWSDEKRQGTDELLLTLPATDLEIVLGKYLAALGVYSASLALSLSHVLVLIFLGGPDFGLMFGNYLGFWFIGASFIAVGMLASLLSPNVTLSFVMGAIFCSVFTFINDVGSIFGKSVENSLAALTVFGPFADFSRGVISLSGFLYFLSLAGVMLYINIILIGKRHWPQKADGYDMWIHYAGRAVAVIIAVISINVILGRISLRLDVTAEQMHSLSGETHRLLDDIPDDHRVLIQVYVSDDVPQQYVQTRENLLSFLAEIDAVAGGKVEVLIHRTEPFSAEARDAREKFGILPREMLETGSARAQVMQVFMGVAFTSGAEEEVIPFFDRGLPTEYELTRSIRVVAKAERKKIGVLTTGAKLFGGLDFQTMQSAPAWQVVEELKKQYDVSQISAADPITEPLDGLVAVLPSSLPQEELDNLLDYVFAGNPTLIVVDPFPYFNISLAPVENPGANQNPFMNQGPPPASKGDILGLMGVLGVQWNPGQVIWDNYNPHPDLAQLPPEFVFLGANNEDSQAFNPDHLASSKLQEMLMLFPGSIKKTPESQYDFIPLLKSSAASGSLMYRQMVQRSFLGTQMVYQNLPHYPDNSEHIIAAHIRSVTSPGDSTSDRFGKVNAIVIADIDFISDQFFAIRSQGFENLNFDNVNFFLNSMDILVNDESFIDLRNRRVQHRTLETVESRVRDYDSKRLLDEQQAETEAQIALQAAQQRLNERVSEVRQRTDLDDQTKEIMVRSLQEVENDRYDALEKTIREEKEIKIQRSKEDMESQIRSIQNNIKTLAVIIPPIPVFVFGIMIYLRRKRREQEGVAAIRRLRE